MKSSCGGLYPMMPAHDAGCNVAGLDRRLTGMRGSASAADVDPFDQETGRAYVTIKLEIITNAADPPEEVENGAGYESLAHRIPLQAPFDPHSGDPDRVFPGNWVRCVHSHRFSHEKPGVQLLEQEVLGVGRGRRGRADKEVGAAHRREAAESA